MMREPTARRRSPESSRRRRAERRHSREQLAAAAAVAAGVVAAQPAPLLPQQLPPGPEVGDRAIIPPVSSSQTHTPTQHMTALSSSQTQTPTQRQYHRSRADSTTSASSSTSSSLVNVSRRSRFGIRNFFALSSVKKVKKRRSFKRKNYSTSSVDSDLAYGNGYVSRSSIESTHRPSPSQHQQIPQYPQHRQPYTPGAFSLVSGAYPAPPGPYSPHHYSQHGHHSGQGYPPPLPHQYGQPHPQQGPNVGPDGPPVLKRVQTDEEIIAIGRKLSDLARAENLRDLERQGKSRPSRMVATATAVSAFHRKNSGGTRGISSSRPNKSQSSSSDEEWESASDSDSDSDSPSSDSDSGLAYGSMPRFSDPILPPLTALAGTAGVMGAAIGAGSLAPTIISERPSEAIRPPDRKPSAVDPAMFGPVNSLRGYVNTPCGFRPGEYVSPVHSQYQSPALAHRVTAENPIPLPGSASNEALVQRQRQQQHGFDQPITATNLGTPVQIQAPRPRIPVSPQVLEERGHHREHEISTGSPKKRRERERERDKESSISAALPAVVGAIGAAVVAGAVMNNNKDEGRRPDEKRDERPLRDDDYDRERRRRYDDDARRNTIDINDKRDERYNRRDYDRPPTSDATRSDERYRERERERDRHYDTPTGRDRDDDRYSRREPQNKGGISEVITPAVIGAVAGAVLAAGARRDSKTSPVHRTSPSLERDDGYKERMRLEQEVKRHREDSERHAREEQRLRDEYEVRMKEIREKAEEEERRAREEKKKQDWIEQQERIVREQRKIIYQQERVANDEREKAERDRRSRDANQKREREEKRALEASGGREPSRDKERSRDRRKDVIVVVEGRPDVADSVPAPAPAPARSEVSKGKEHEVAPPPSAPALDEKKPPGADSLAPAVKKKSKEERRQAREELRKLLAETQKQIEAEKERARRLAELEAIQGAPSAITVEPPAELSRGEPSGSSSSRAPAVVDPFQFQVPTDAFPTPSHTPPTDRPLTPAILTVEPDWDRLEPEPEGEVRERLSRRESYELEIARAQKIVEETNKSTIPADPATIAAAIAVVESSENDRERSRSRAPSRGRDREPVRDPVQEEANRVYRERKIAERIAGEESRSRSVSPSPSIMDKYEDNGEDPVVRIVTPPEMKRAPKKSVFDGPNADVRIDNVIMPHDLVKYQAPPAIPGVNPAMMMPIFKSRDPSCERERPMLILVLPTPAVSPNPEKMMRSVSSSSQAATVVDAEPPKEKDEPATPPRSPKKETKIIMTRRGEAVEVPDDYDTGRVRESPESRDASQERKPLKFKFASPGKKTNAWSSTLAAAIAGATALAAKRKEEAKAAEAAAEASGSRAIEGESASAAVVEEKPKPAIVTAEPPSEPREVVPEREQRDTSPGPAISEPPSTPPQQRRYVPIDLEDETPPRVGPKPTSSSPSLSRMPGSFEEDLDFNATVAAGLQASGFDPNIVIKNEDFRRRDSPRGSTQPFYVPPSAETVTDPSDSSRPSPSVVTAAPTELPIVPAQAEQDFDSSPRRKSNSSELSRSGSGSKKNNRRSHMSTRKDYIDIPEHEEPPDRPNEEDLSGKVPSNLSREASSFQVVDQPKEESFRVVERELSSTPSDPVGQTNDAKHITGNAQQTAENRDKQSFLARAGTSGDGAGLMEVQAFASPYSHLNAVLPSSIIEEVFKGLGEAKDTQEPIWRRERSISYSSQKVDPEVQVHREIKPAIDPQFGDLLPLPPSEPNSPEDPSFYELDDFFPSLPESRPNTPPQEQRTRSATVSSRRQGQGHVRTPSRTAVPLPLVMGRRSVPSSPRVGRSSPVQAVEQPYSPPKSRQARPTSWDMGKEYKPLWLIEKKGGEEKRAPNVVDYPALPESESEPPSSAPESPGFDTVDRDEDVDVGYLQRGGLGLAGASIGALGALGAGRMLQDQLKIDVPLARSFEQQSSGFGSGETTPRAFAADEFAQSPEARRTDIESLEQMSPVGSVHLESQSTTDKEDDVQELEQLSPVVVPFKAPARQLAFGDELEFLPALPESLPNSPLEKGPSPSSAPLVFGGPLEELPSLPDSPIQQLAKEEASASTLSESRALSPLQDVSTLDVPVETLELPSLESSYGTSIDDKNSPHTREDGTELLLASSGPASPVPSTMPQTTESPEVVELPALPDSAPASPVQNVLPGHFEEMEELPPLPESRADSPVHMELASPPVAVLPHAGEFEDASALPALPQEQPGTPDHERFPALPRSRAPSPVPSANLPALPASTPGSPVIDTLPGLPASRSPSPVSSGLSVSDLPLPADNRVGSRSFSDLSVVPERMLVPDVFADLPALPDSEPATLVHTDLPVLSETKPLSPIVTAQPTTSESQPAVSASPTLPESRSATPVVSDVLASVEDGLGSPVFEDVSVFPDNKPLSPVLSALPPLPDSTPESPVVPAEAISVEEEAVVDDEVDHLDCKSVVVESEPSSPVSLTQQVVASSRSLGPVFPGLSALPKSRPASPVLSPLPARPDIKPVAPVLSATPNFAESRPASLAPSFTPRPRSGSHFFTTLFSLPVLSGVQSLSKSRPSSPLQKPSLANETLEEIPALPLSESGPVSPIEDLSKSLAEALEKVSESRFEAESRPESPVELAKSPVQTFEDVSQLPALPDSQPESPLVLAESSARTVLDASPTLPPSESRSISPHSKPVDFSDLPALPESLPMSPVLEHLPVLGNSQPATEDLVDSNPAVVSKETPTLPESRPPSPLHDVELPTLSESRPDSPIVDTLQQQSSPVFTPVVPRGLESLPALPESELNSPIFEPVLSQGHESLPALPESTPISPAVEPTLAQQPEVLPALSENALPAPSESLPASPLLEALPILELDSLPALPESKPGSPIVESVTTHELASLPVDSEDTSTSPAPEPVRATEPESFSTLSETASPSPIQHPMVRQLPDGILNNLPALPESPLASPVERPVELQSLEALPLPESQPASAIQVSASSSKHDEYNLDQLPALPESRQNSPLLEPVLSEHQEILPAVPLGVSSSPVHVPVPRQFPQDDTDELPALPDSQPVSPAHAPVSRQFPDEFADSLPALSKTQPTSSAQDSFSSQSQEAPLDTLPALPESQPISPVQDAFPALPGSRSPSPSQLTLPQLVDARDEPLVDTPALPVRHSFFPIEVLEPRQLPSLDFDSLPALPESQPTTPVEDSGSTQLHGQDFSDLPTFPDSLPVSPAQTSAPQLPAQDLDNLPSLPESRPGSPTVRSMPAPDYARPLSPVQAPIEQVFNEGVETLPALLDSRPVFPLETTAEAAVEIPVEAPVEAAADAFFDALEAPDEVSEHEPPEQDFKNLPALPESPPTSPVPDLASPQLPRKESDDLSALPESRSVSRNQDLEDLPVLSESQPMSPTQAPATPEVPKEDLDQLPALPDSPLSSAEAAQVQLDAVEVNLADLPALPQSRASSPVHKPVLPLIVTDLEKAETVPSPRSTVRELAGVQEQDFATLSQVTDGNDAQIYEPPSSYSDVKTPPSPITRRALEKEKELDDFDKGKSVFVDTAAAAGPASTLVVANMRQNGSQPDIQRLGSEMQILPSQEKSESVYSFNEDGTSTVAASEAPTYLSGSTFYESQLSEPTKKKDSPRQTFSSLLGLWSKREKTQPEPPAVSKVVAKVVPATTPEEEMSEDGLVPSPTKKDKKKKKQRKGEKEGSESGSGSQQEQQRGESSGGLNILSSNQSTNDQPASSIVNKPVVSRYLPDEEPSPSPDHQHDEPSHDANVALETEEFPAPDEILPAEEVPATEEPPTPGKKSKNKKKKAKKAAAEAADVAEEEAAPEAPPPEQDIAAENMASAETQAPSSGELDDSAKDQGPGPQPPVRDDVDDVEPAEKEEHIAAAPSRSGSISSPTTPTLTRDITKKGILSMLPAVSPFRPGFWGIKKQEPATQTILEEGPELQSQQTEQGLGLGESSDRSIEVGPAEDVHKPEAKEELGLNTASLALDTAVSLVESPILVQDEAKIDHEATKELSDERQELVEAEVVDVDVDDKEESKDTVRNEEKESTSRVVDEPVVAHEPVQDVFVPEITAAASEDVVQEEAVDEPLPITASENVEVVEPATKKNKKKKKKKKAAATATENLETSNATNTTEQSVSELASEPSASSGQVGEALTETAPAEEVALAEDIAVLSEVTPTAEAVPPKETAAAPEAAPAQVKEIPASTTTSSKKSKKKKKKKNASQSTENLTTVPIFEEPPVPDTTVQHPSMDSEPETKQIPEDAAAILISADDELQKDADDSLIDKQEPKSMEQPLEEHKIPGQVSRDSSEQPNISHGSDSTTPRGEDDNKPHQTEAHPVSEVFSSSFSPAQLPEKSVQNNRETVESALNEISSDRQDGVPVTIPHDLLLPDNNDAAVQDVSKEEPGFDTISLQQEQDLPTAPPLTTEATPELEPVIKEETDTGDGLAETKSTHGVKSGIVERGFTAPLVAADSTIEVLTGGASGRTAVTQSEPIAIEEAAALVPLPEEVESDFPTDTTRAEEEKTPPIDEDKAASSVAQGEVQQRPEEGRAETPAVPAATPLQEQQQLGDIAVPPPQQPHLQQQENSFQALQPIPTAASPIDATQLHELRLASSPIGARPRSVSFALEAISPGAYTPTSSGAMSPVTEHESEDASGPSSRYTLRSKKREKRKKSTALKAVASPTDEEHGWLKTNKPASLGLVDSPKQQASPSQESFDHQLGTVAEETPSAIENDADSISDARSVLSLALGKRAETPSEFGGSMADSEGTVGEKNEEAGPSVMNGLLLATRLKRVAGRFRERREKAAAKKKSGIAWPSSEQEEKQNVEEEVGKEDEVMVEVAAPDSRSWEVKENVEEQAVATNAPYQQAEQTTQEKGVALGTPLSQLTEQLAQKQTSEQQEAVEQETTTAVVPRDLSPIPEESASEPETGAAEESAVQDSTPVEDTTLTAEFTTAEEVSALPEQVSNEESAVEPTKTRELEVAPEQILPIAEPVSASDEAAVKQSPLVLRAIQEEQIEEEESVAAREPTAEPVAEEAQVEVVEEIAPVDKAPAEEPAVAEAEHRATEDPATAIAEPLLETTVAAPESLVEPEVPVRVELPVADIGEPAPTFEKPSTVPEEITAPSVEGATPAVEVNIPALEQSIMKLDDSTPETQDQESVVGRNISLDAEPQLEPEVVPPTQEAELSISEPELTPAIQIAPEAQLEPASAEVVEDVPEQSPAAIKLEAEVGSAVTEHEQLQHRTDELTEAMSIPLPVEVEDSSDLVSVAEPEQRQPEFDEFAEAISIPLPEDLESISEPTLVAEVEQPRFQQDELAEALTTPLPDEAEEIFDLIPVAEIEQVQVRLDIWAEALTVPLPEDSESKVEVEADTPPVMASDDVQAVAVVEKTAPVAVEELIPTVNESAPVVEEPIFISESEQAVDVTSTPAETSVEEKSPLLEKSVSVAEDIAPASEEPINLLTADEESAPKPDFDRELAFAAEIALPEATADEIELPATPPGQLLVDQDLVWATETPLPEDTADEVELPAIPVEELSGGQGFALAAATPLPDVTEDELDLVPTPTKECSVNQDLALATETPFPEVTEDELEPVSVPAVDSVPVHEELYTSREVLAPETEDIALPTVEELISTVVEEAAPATIEESATVLAEESRSEVQPVSTVETVEGPLEVSEMPVVEEPVVQGLVLEKIIVEEVVEGPAAIEKPVAMAEESAVTVDEPAVVVKEMPVPEEAVATVEEPKVNIQEPAIAEEPAISREVPDSEQVLIPEATNIDEEVLVPEEEVLVESPSLPVVETAPEEPASTLAPVIEETFELLAKKKKGKKKKKKAAENEAEILGVASSASIEESTPTIPDLTAEPTIEEPTIVEPTIVEPTIEEPTIEETMIEESTPEEPTIEGPSVTTHESVEPVIATPAVEEAIVLASQQFTARGLPLLEYVPEPIKSSVPAIQEVTKPSKKSRKKKKKGSKAGSSEPTSTIATPSQEFSNPLEPTVEEPFLMPKSQDEPTEPMAVNEPKSFLSEATAVPLPESDTEDEPIPAPEPEVTKPSPVIEEFDASDAALSELPKALDVEGEPATLTAQQPKAFEAVGIPEETSPIAKEPASEALVPEPSTDKHLVVAVEIEPAQEVIRQQSKAEQLPVAASQPEVIDGPVLEKQTIEANTLVVDPVQEPSRDRSLEISNNTPSSPTLDLEVEMQTETLPDVEPPNVAASPVESVELASLAPEELVQEPSQDHSLDISQTSEIENAPLAVPQPDATEEQASPVVEEIVNLPTQLGVAISSRSIPQTEQEVKVPAVAEPTLIEDPLETSDKAEIAPSIDSPVSIEEHSIPPETTERSVALSEEPITEFRQISAEQQDEVFVLPVIESKKQKRKKNKKKGKKIEVENQPESSSEVTPAPGPSSGTTLEPALEPTSDLVIAAAAESTPEISVQLVKDPFDDPVQEPTTALEVAPVHSTREAEVAEKPTDRQLPVDEPLIQQPESKIRDFADEEFFPLPTKKSKKNKKRKNVPAVIDDHDGGSGVTTPLIIEEQKHALFAAPEAHTPLVEKASNGSPDAAILVEERGSAVGDASIEESPVPEETPVTETPTVEVSVVETSDEETPSVEDAPIVEVEILDAETAPVVEVDVVEETPTVEQEPVYTEVQEPIVINMEEEPITIALPKPISRQQTPDMLTREAEVTPLPPSRPQTPVLEKVAVPLPSTPPSQQQAGNHTVVTPAPVTRDLGLLPEISLLPPISLERTPPWSVKEQVDLTPAQESSHISHDPPFEYEGRRKKVKTVEAEQVELDEPAVPAGAEVDESSNKGKNKEEAVVAATALAGGVSLFDKLKEKEKEEWRVMGDANISVLTSGWDDMGSVLGGAPVYEEYDEKGKKVVGSLYDEEDEDKVEKKARRSWKTEAGLGRMDSETIPRSVRELSKAKTEDTSERGRKMERGKSSPSPEPVQRSFSFPDDIADEEAFETRDTTGDEKKEHVREMVPVADQPVQLPRMSSFGDFMRSHASLPPVQEELSEEDEPKKQKTPVRLNTPAHHALRDSGLGGESPRVSRGLQPGETEHLRDSGVHLTPRNSTEVERQQKRRSPLGGSVRLLEPSPPPHTPEPEKSAVASAVPSSSSAKRIGPNTSIQRLRTPEPLRPDSPGSVGSIRSHNTTTPPLRRMDKRTSGNLRSGTSSQTELAAKAREQGHGQNSSSTDLSPAIAITGAAALGALAAATTTTTTSTGSSSTSPPIANEGRTRAAKDMSDVFEAYGEGRIGSPRSPTRPHSMRRRQSLQVIELEARVEQLIHENQQLANSRAQAESQLARGSLSSDSDREYEIEQLKRALNEANGVIERLKQTNEGLRNSTSAIAVQHHEEVRRYEAQQAQAAKELQKQARSAKEKDAEIAHLRTQLEASTEEIKRLQQQILEQSRASVDSDFLDVRDIDYFDHRCQQLCAHVSQWVLRFSKFSDMRACRLTNELSDEKLIDRLDNAVLDGSNVDTYLNDRVRRRDIFMSMTMTMIWEFVFTRYLFGMDREQRQKLKHLEKQLIDVGPPHAVRQWRAVTLTLLSRRPGFKRQRDQDTEAVVQAILDTLAKILPPPSNLEDQIQAQLRRVVREAVGLAIEMRCQRAEYIMLPPLQPEYDDAGELVEDVKFNAALMNDGGQSNLTNEELESTAATVRVVLFPLVLVARSAYASPATPTQSIRGKNVRLLTPISDAGGGASVGGRSPKQERGVMGPPPQPGLRGQGSDVSMGDHGGYV
ncbi:hypothetical protein QC764_107530 [Podospora pseudoanserina]|uniref:Involucrin repeat protein n=1 Tax=Podospora pseudoanserina TaxID=2609844 RepID=A0ABR0INT9_9PEZI|nr:hypothetical protein QC764_107530 [Podospora pseudoanserina]